MHVHVIYIQGVYIQSSDGREEEVYLGLQTVPVVEIRKVRPE